MIVKFDRSLYSEEAIKRAYTEFFNLKPKSIRRSKSDFLVEIPATRGKDDIPYFENMVLLYTIEDRRR